MRRAWSSRRLPAGVAVTPCLLRTKSGWPARSSSFFNCSLTDDCDRNTRSAPAETLPDSATATKVRNCVEVESTLAHDSVYPMEVI